MAGQVILIFFSLLQVVAVTCPSTCHPQSPSCLTLLDELSEDVCCVGRRSTQWLKNQRVHVPSYWIILPKSAEIPAFWPSIKSNPLGLSATSFTASIATQRCCRNTSELLAKTIKWLVCWWPGPTISTLAGLDRIEFDEASTFCCWIHHAYFRHNCVRRQAAADLQITNCKHGSLKHRKKIGVSCKWVAGLLYRSFHHSFLAPACIRQFRKQI